MIASLRVQRVFAVALLPLALAAQDAKPDLAAATQQLQAALHKASKLQSVAFKTLESRDDAMMRQMPIGGADDVQVTGTWHSGVTQAKVGADEDHQVLFANGRMVAREGEGSWKLRRGCLGDGQPLPFVLDVGAVVAVLCHPDAKPLTVAHVETGKHKDKEVTTYGVVCSPEVADDVAMALMPRGSGGPMFHFAGGGGMQMPKPDVKVDLAFSVETATGQLVRLQAKSYTKTQFPAGVQFRIGGADGEEIEVGGDEEPEQAETGPVEFHKGLPKRKLGKSTSLTTFDVALSQHDAVKQPELAGDCKRLLGVK